MGEMERNTTVQSSTMPYLYDAAPARCCPHGLQDDGVLVASTGESDSTPPATGHSGRDELWSSVAAEPVSVSVSRHVDEDFKNTRRGRN